MSEYLLEVNNLKTWFYTFRGVVKAVDGVSFSLKKGEVLGIVGESGCGKSITGFSILKLIDPPGQFEGGGITFEGEDLLAKSEKEMHAIRGNKISMVFQDPMTSLNPLYTIGQQIEESLAIHQTQLSKKERRAKAIELLKAVGIPAPQERIGSYPHEFSGGMRQRVIIAISLATNPELIIADEPTTALDVTVQAQIIRRLLELVRSQNTSLILITHDLALVSEAADKIVVMYCGKVIERGTVFDIIESPSHPYTVGLLRSIPRLTDEQSRLEQIPGMVPSPFDLPTGCKFSPRCRYCQEVCRREEPEEKVLTKEHRVACHFPLKGGLACE
ncbi:MAG: Oligopeptide transport ATP-binding protein OppD [Anaerosporomusa subterranea]|jgi:oligopeptide transport system ATP-binding protein|nr:Oligopeptide transport ATP-binding protein OppD [Anaerosporomusa subterranea]